MHILSAAEMHACDQLTSEQFGVASLELMRSAAKAVAGFALQQFPQARRVTVLCGRGNNGGDGLMVARLLAVAGRDVTVMLLGAPDGLKDDTAIAWAELLDANNVTGRVVLEAKDLVPLNDLRNADLIVDAVVGTGFKPPLRGLALAVLNWIKDTSAPILAVDLPSGWGSDETCASASGPVFPADAVLTLTAPKPVHVFGHLTRRANQPVVVAAIGSPEAAIAQVIGAESARLRWTGESLPLVQQPRATTAHKGNFGHVLVIGGSCGKSGAPAMASLAALRAGAGLVTAAVPAPMLLSVASITPELMSWPLLATADGCIAKENANPTQMAALMVGKTVLAIGPGMGQEAETEKFMRELLAATRVPVVLDADALNLLATQPELLRNLAKERTVILTPHPGEMARLAGITTAEVQANRMELAQNFAQQIGVTLVLKGDRTLVAHPNGTVAVNTTGNPGMAKAGSGDLLTGLIAGLLAQYPADSVRAVEAAVYLHGLAADFAVQAADEHTLLATDSLRQLARAFRFQSRDGNGYIWLQGLPANLPATNAWEETR